MTAIYVDADACPVKDEVMRVVRRHQLVVHMVSNQWMRLDDDPLVHRVVVEQGPDIADDWIAERAGPGDIAITADYDLLSLARNPAWTVRSSASRKRKRSFLENEGL